MFSLINLLLTIIILIRVFKVNKFYEIKQNVYYSDIQDQANNKNNKKYYK